jgi:hypothetical protein
VQSDVNRTAEGESSNDWSVHQIASEIVTCDGPYPSTRSLQSQSVLRADSMSGCRMKTDCRRLLDTRFSSKPPSRVETSSYENHKK